MTSFTSGHIGVYDGTSYHGNTSAIGEHSVTFTANSTTFFMLATSGSTLSVDNVSVKKVDLKGYWRNNGTDAWTDLSEYGNNGTVNGSPTTIQLQEVPYFKKDTFGLPMNRVRQKGLNFDTSDYVEITDNDTLTPSTTAFTIECWVKSNVLINSSSHSNHVNIIDKQTGSSDNSWWLAINNDGKLQLGSEGGNIQSTTASWAADTWFHLVATYRDDGDGTYSGELYVNRTAESLTNDNLESIANDDAPVRIGKGEHLGWDGIIDDVKIYDRALTVNEVTKNYKATKSKHKNNTVSNWSDDFSDSFI